MTRRDFGTVRRLPSGRWQARYSAPDGSRVAAERTFGTRAEAAAYLAGVQADLHRGSYADPVGAETLGEYATTWLARRADLWPRTAELYEGLLNRHLLPHLGDVPLSRLTPAAIRRWHAGRLRAGVGRSTVAKAYRLLKTILNTAVADEVLPRNPCLLRGAGSERTPKRVPPTLPEAYALADAIQPRWRMLVLLATWSGLRWGELVALRRSSIDLDFGRLMVRDQLVETATGWASDRPRPRPAVAECSSRRIFFPRSPSTWPRARCCAEPLGPGPAPESRAVAGTASGTPASHRGAGVVSPRIVTAASVSAACRPRIG